MSPLVRINDPDELTLRVSLESLTKAALMYADAAFDAADRGDPTLTMACRDDYRAVRRQMKSVQAQMRLERG